MKELEMIFKGTGEVSIYDFKQVKKTEKGYIYAIYDKNNVSHYEVFKRKENARFGCVSYPKSNSFGLWAWTFKSFELATNKLNCL